MPSAVPRSDEVSQAILALGRIRCVALEGIMQCPHSTAAQIKVKIEVEFAGGRLVSPYRARRSLGPLGRLPQQTGCRRFIEPNQLGRLGGSDGWRPGGLRPERSRCLVAGAGILPVRGRRRGGFARRVRDRGTTKRGRRRKLWRLNSRRLWRRLSLLDAAGHQRSRSQAQQGRKEEPMPPPRTHRRDYVPLGMSRRARRSIAPMSPSR